MNQPTIAGIQQIGIGVPNVHEAFKWYRQHFGMDIPVFEEAAEAYKNIDTVIQSLLDFDLIDVIATFKPSLTYKS